ncbi:MAG: heterodisulfide reductase-related iron-sulfur binding cluster, partial [Methanomassiliicoccaceae archaeon]|nr:heterodisulfide reductase-related iron-sulfur binding cluster [Methanomassiliicoccaceae archaeon]
GCFKTVSSDFGNHYSRATQSVYHITQYVEKLINEKKLPFNNPINAKVTYHDPCHLGRHSGVFDAPRNILKKIKGIQFVEMDRNRNNSRCCGAGGGYKSAFNDFAVNVAAERIRDAEEVGAEIIATACPFCVLNLTAGAKKIQSKVKVMDISEMLLKVTAPVEAPPVEAKPVAVPAPEPIPIPEPVVVPEPVIIYVGEEAEEGPAYDEDSDVLSEETIEDTGELKLRRRLWRRGYRYRKMYGRDTITIAFLKAKVAVYVEDGPNDALDERVRRKGWEVLRFNEKDITDAKKEAEEVIDAIERSRHTYAEEAADSYTQERSTYAEADDEVLDETIQDTGELRLRRRLWAKGYRYRKEYGREKITIAFLKARVAVYVGPDAKEKDIDSSLRAAGWTVLRFKESSIKDAKRESDKVIAAIERSLNALMNEAVPVKDKVRTEQELLEDEQEDDPADLKLRRILWKNDYRYRRRYGREKITVAFRRAKVGAFVCKDIYRRKGDEQLVKRGWTIMRFKESAVTDAKKEAERVMAAIDRNIYLLGKGIIPEGRNLTIADAGEDDEVNTPEYRLRMALWRTNRYRRHYGEHKINIAYPASKVAVFVDETGMRRPCDDALEENNWVVLRFKGVNITDGAKEANKVMAAIEKNRDYLEELEFEGGEEEEDLSYLLEDTPEGRVRRAVWNKRVRYRRNYSRYKIDMAFVKIKLAVFFGEPKKKTYDENLERKGWAVMRVRIPEETDGQEEAAVIYKAVKERKKALKKLLRAKKAKKAKKKK